MVPRVDNASRPFSLPAKLCYDFRYNMQSKIQKIKQRISSAAKASGRDPNSIKLVGISKTKPNRAIQEAYKLGIQDFGENYMQEAVSKVSALRKEMPGAKWHFIGPLQSNKAKDLAQYFDYFHALDRESLAKKIQSHLEKFNRKLRAFIQVNIDAEESKSGISPSRAEELLKELSTFDQIRVVGLMCIPSREQSSPSEPFCKLAALQRRLNTSAVYPHELTELSMGMTKDFEAAIQEGATMVRIGTAIFGERL